MLTSRHKEYQWQEIWSDIHKHLLEHVFASVEF